MINKENTILPLLALCLGFFMVIMDVTIVNVALPSIVHDLNGGISWLQWVVDGYTLTFAGVLLSAGFLGDRIGAKTTFICGLLLFVMTSIGCGFAANFLQLTIFRFLQGIAAALLVPTSLALINACYDDKTQRAKAIGIWASIGGIAAAAGPLLGAVLTTYFNWRAIFFVNIPIGTLAVVLTIQYVLSQPHKKNQTTFDLVGQATGIISIAALAFSLIEAGRLGWLSETVIIGFGIFALFFSIFLLVEYHSKAPMFPLKLFRSSTFSSAIAIGMILNIGVYGELFVLSLYFQDIKHYSVLMTGLAFMPLLGITAITSYFGGKVTSAAGPKLPMIIGLAIGAFGFLTLLVTANNTPYVVLIIPLMAIGFGVAFTMPAATVATIQAAPENRAGIASGALNSSRQTGSLIGVAIFGTLVNSHYHFMTGLHYTLIIAGTAYLIGCLLAAIKIKSIGFDK